MRKTDAAVSGNSACSHVERKRRTAETMSVSDAAALHPFDRDRPALAPWSLLEDLTVFTLDPDAPLVAARPRGRTA